VLPDLQLPQDGFFCIGVRANRGSNRHAKSIAESDGIAQDRFLVGANSPIWPEGGGTAAPSKRPSLPSHVHCRDGMDAPCSGVECARMEVSLLQTREHP